MQRPGSFWPGFKGIAIVFSFTINFVLVVVLVAVTVPGIEFALRLKTDWIEPLLDNVDAAFVGLGEAKIDADIAISDSVDIVFDLALDQSVPIGSHLPIERDVSVVRTEDVLLSNMPANFTLPGGAG